MNFEISKELKSIRIRKNMSMKEVANKIGISQESIRRYEINCENMSIKILSKLLELYDINFYVFFENMRAFNHTPS